MKIHALTLIALGVLAGSARADVSDSGNLTIGGQGLIVGTMTVTGNAFSVGGSTFVVGGGSVTMGGILNAAAAGIKWADGSVSTSASLSGAGDMLLGSTQTVGGYKLFGSTIGVGNTAVGVYNTTATYTAVIRGGTSEVALSTFSSVTAVQFTNLYSSYTHHVEFRVYLTTPAAGIPYFRVEGDAGSDYEWSTMRVNSSGSVTGEGGRPATECKLFGSNAAAGNPIEIYITASRTINNKTDKMHFSWHGTFALDAGGLLQHVNGSCEYAPNTTGDGRVSLTFYAPSSGGLIGAIQISADVPSVAF